MSSESLLEVKLSEVANTITPTKKLRRSDRVHHARELVQKRGRLPAITAIKDVKGDRYLVAFGNKLLAGALLAYEEDPTLGDYLVHLRLIRQPQIKTKTTVYSHDKFCEVLRRRATKAGWIVDGKVHIDAFLQRARAVIARVEAASALKSLRVDEATGADAFPIYEQMVDGDNDIDEVFVEEPSELLSAEATKRLREMLKEEKGKSGEDDAAG